MGEGRLQIGRGDGRGDGKGKGREGKARGLVPWTPEIERRKEG
jgi:hypothetical protein